MSESNLGVLCFDEEVKKERKMQQIHLTIDAAESFGISSDAKEARTALTSTRCLISFMNTVIF